MRVLAFRFGKFRVSLDRRLVVRHEIGLVVHFPSKASSRVPRPPPAPFSDGSATARRPCPPLAHRVDRIDGRRHEIAIVDIAFVDVIVTFVDAMMMNQESMDLMDQSNRSIDRSESTRCARAFARRRLARVRSLFARVVVASRSLEATSFGRACCFKPKTYPHYKTNTVFTYICKHHEHE